MSQVETELIHLLQQLVAATKGIVQTTYRPWWEIWGPPIVSVLITAIGWIVIVRANQKNNRDLMELQTKEQARTKILDALDEYADYLRDLAFPRMVILRDEAMHCRAPRATKGAMTASVGTRVDCAAIEGVITSLTLFDARERHWTSVLHHCSWVYDPDTETSQKVTELLSAHKAIMDDQFDFYADLAAKARESEGAVVTFLEKDRSSESAKRIDEQFERIHAIRVKLNAPAFLRDRGRTTRKPKSG